MLEVIGSEANITVEDCEEAARLFKLVAMKYPGVIGNEAFNNVELHYRTIETLNLELLFGL